MPAKHAKKREKGTGKGLMGELRSLHLSRVARLQQLRLAAPLLVQLIVAGCAFHKAPAPPPPTYPALPESAIQELRRFPSGAYDKVEVITIEAEVGADLLSAMRSVRQAAAQKGANAVVILSDAEFPQKVDKREVKIRRIVYLAIHRR
jgi:hypothetical protein